MLTTLLFTDDAAIPAVLEGVTAKVYVSGVLFRQGTSGADGKVVLDDLPVGDHTVIVGFPFNPGFSVTNPYSLSIEDEDAVYTFVLARAVEPTGDTFVCACSGMFYDSAGEPIQDAVMRFRPVNAFNTRTVSGASSAILMAPVSCNVRNGYAEVSLLRGVTYLSDVPWMRPDTWTVEVPDQVSASLPLVLFPFVDRVEFDPSTLSLAVGEMDFVDVTVVYRSGLRQDGTDFASEWPVEFTVDSPEVVAVVRRENGRLEARALSAGTARVSACRPTADQPLQARPDTGVVGYLDVTVG